MQQLGNLMYLSLRHIERGTFTVPWAQSPDSGDWEFVRQRRERASVQKVAGKFHYRRRAARPGLRNSCMVKDNAQDAGKPKGTSTLSPHPGHREAEQAGPARPASRAPARPGSPGFPLPRPLVRMW